MGHPRLSALLEGAFCHLFLACYLLLQTWMNIIDLNSKQSAMFQLPVLVGNDEIAWDPG